MLVPSGAIKSKLWLDDVRPPPPDDSWYWAKTVADAKLYFSLVEITEMSLDHDMGQDEDTKEYLPTGYDFLVWMAQEGLWPLQRPIVHSFNYPARKAMLALLGEHWPEGLTRAEAFP